MSKQLLFYVEGRTEMNFVANTLNPHFAGQLLCRPPIPAANSLKKGRTSRGGVRSYHPIKRDLHRLMKQHSGPDVWFTTLIDLYGLPKDFPGQAQASQQTAGRDKAEAIAKAWSQDMDDDRFIPFVFSYEFETLVLAEPDSLLAVYPDSVREVKALKKEIDTFRNPEEINDSYDTAPSRRIAKHLPDYQKPTNGPLAVQTTGLDKIRQRCPHFNAWLSTLERL